MIKQNQTKTANCNLHNEYVDSRSATQFLNVSRRTLQRLRDSGKIPYYQPSRKTLYKLDDLRNYLSQSFMPTFNATEGTLSK